MPIYLGRKLIFARTKMGFISFNESYYRKKLETLERRNISRDDIYEAQQLLKLLDDLADEGYTKLNNQMENDFSCLSRLHAIINKAGYSQLPVEQKRLPHNTYTEKEYKLNNILDEIIKKAQETNKTSNNVFLKNISNYSEWIGYKKDTAYIFLLRDALLPYVYFKSKKRESIYPWLISRRFIEDKTGILNLDDAIRSPIYEALESGYIEFQEFYTFCKERIQTILGLHTKLKQALLTLLELVKEKKIIVIESGYSGTIPMMLKAIDDRVSFKLYTTAPFLYDTYKDFIFCHRYEDIRKFETVYSHDFLFRYSSFHEGKFYVKISDDNFVKYKAIKEIKRFIQADK